MFDCVRIVLHRRHFLWSAEKEGSCTNRRTYTQHMRPLFHHRWLCISTILWSGDEIETTEIRKICHTNIACNCQRLARSKRKKNNNCSFALSTDQQTNRDDNYDDDNWRTEKFNLLHAAHSSLWTRFEMAYHCWLQLQCQLSIRLKSFKCSVATQRQNQNEYISFAILSDWERDFFSPFVDTAFGHLWFFSIVETSKIEHWIGVICWCFFMFWKNKFNKI